MRVRKLRAVLVPILVITAIPYLLLRDYPPRETTIAWQVAGTVVFVLGFLLAVWCFTLFGGVGGGTIMPWDPTRKLVSVGPYRYMRNPMISGVLSMLVGEALFWRSLAIALLALTFFLINHIYFIVSEEPGLEKRFGESYRQYKARVPRWLPRF